jgi:TIR domain
VQPRVNLSPVLESAKLENSVEIFCSYAHRDEVLRKEFETHVAILQRNKLVQVWHDRQIGAGGDWAGDIDEHLNSADIITLFVSADFLASDYCYEKELSRALERAAQKQALVVPIIVRPCDWSDAAFAHLQAIPAGAKAVTSWTNRDEAWTDVAVSLKIAVRQVLARKLELAALKKKFLAGSEAALREHQRIMTEMAEKIWQITQDVMLNKRKGDGPLGDFSDYVRQ